MINKEDKADVARHMGKALAKKVARATNDKLHGKVTYLRPNSRTDEGKGMGHSVVSMVARYKKSDLLKRSKDTSVKEKEYTDNYEKTLGGGHKAAYIRPEDKGLYGVKK